MVDVIEILQMRVARGFRTGWKPSVLPLFAALFLVVSLSHADGGACRIAGVAWNGEHTEFDESQMSSVVG